MNLRVLEDGKVLVSIPDYVPMSKAEEFVKAKSSWIEKQRNKIIKIKDLKETKEFKPGEQVYFLGKKYKLKVIPAKLNQVILGEDNLEIYIKEKFVNNNEYIKKCYEKWLKECCYNFCQKFVLIYQNKMQKYNIPLPEIQIKNLKSRWGACIPAKKSVVFSMNLVKTPIECLEYVVVHELAHFKYLNHSKKFYSFVSLYIPDWAEKRKILNDEYSRIII